MTSVFRQKHIALHRAVGGANATKGNGVWDSWLEADQAVCFPDGSGVGRQAAKRLLAKHHRRGHPAAGNTQVPGQTWNSCNPGCLQSIQAHAVSLAAALSTSPWLVAALSNHGGEFKAAFDVAMAQDGVDRWLIYPKTPKMNAHIERFNGSLQNEFAAYHEDLLFTDIDLFNDKLLDYLVWFNTKRPHYGLGLLSPDEYLRINHQCHMYWRKTDI